MGERMKMKLIAITLGAVCIAAWVASHFVIPTFGIETHSGAYGLVIERGSLLFGADGHTFDVLKPFADILYYGDYLGAHPTALETFRGRIAFGPDPRYPWVTGISIPIWLIGLVLAAALLALQTYRHPTTRA